MIKNNNDIVVRLTYLLKFNNMTQKVEYTYNDDVPCSKLLEDMIEMLDVIGYAEKSINDAIDKIK